ncbi:alpha/beta fold hydrolase [Sphingomonas mali]|uniref:alpha/beta fold hydrolase n=1 Tax=Sphingomonas mali TaxID=40682 RepID=UPI0008349344|nr:alpha/beta hydrolase [Sphingomonas mali]
MNHFTLRFAVAVLAPLAILQPNIGHCAPAAAASPAPATGEVRMDHISVTETGKGSPVILIPGLSSPRAVWDGVVPELAKNHRVILVQVNGFAGDDAGANLKPGMLDGIVGDLHGYMAKHKLQGAAVVGHSMGGLVGLMLAKAQPGDVGKLMIVDSLPWYGVLFGPGATVDTVKPKAVVMRDEFAASYGKLDPAANQALATRFARRPDAQAKIAGWMSKTDVRVSAQAMYEDMITDLRGDMGKIATPITMLYPTSVTLPKAVAEPLYTAAYKDALHATLVEVPDSAHFIMLDQPAVFQKTLMAFAG